MTKDGTNHRYRGTRISATRGGEYTYDARVTRDGNPLDRRGDLVDCDFEFDWGHHGGAAAQLAVALLAAEVSGEVALRHYQEFKRQFVSTLPEAWEVTSVDILRALATLNPR